MWRSRTPSCFILLCVFIQTRTLWRCSCYTSLQLSTSLTMAVSDRKTVDELCQYLDGTVKSTPLLCEEFLCMLRPHFNFEFPDFDHVVFDVHGRCNSQYFREHQTMESYLSLNHDWSFSDCKQKSPSLSFKWGLPLNEWMINKQKSPSLSLQ